MHKKNVENKLRPPCVEITDSDLCVFTDLMLFLVETPHIVHLVLCQTFSLDPEAPGAIHTVQQY